MGRLDNASKLALGHNPNGSVPALLDDCVTAALDALLARHGGPPREADGFERLRAAVRAELPETTYDVVVGVARILALTHDLSSRVSGTASAAVLPAWLDVRAQLAAAGAPGVRDGDRRGPAAAPAALPHRGAAPARRTARLGRARPGAAARVEHVEQEHAAWLAGLRPERRADPDVREVRWMLEELRVSLFAQQLGTPYPVSEKRIYRAMDAADS